MVDIAGEINSITSKIADLNVRITTAAGLHSTDGSTLRDQRQQLVEQLSSLMGITYFETESGSFTVATKQGPVLVIGDESRTLGAVPSEPGGLTQVLLAGTNITSEIQSRKLGGLLKVRDTTLAGYLSSLDEMADALIAEVSSQHAQGSDLDGVQGTDFFVPFVPHVPGSDRGAASSIALAISDPTLKAAAASGSEPGSNGNAKSLAAMGDKKLFFSANATLNECYSDLIFNVGIDLQTADEGAQSQGQILLQLQNQRDSISGVNLDEEAINIIPYQKAYQASAQMVRASDQLSEEIVNLLGA